jgi:hypothetical protein
MRPLYLVGYSLAFDRSSGEVIEFFDFSCGLSANRHSSATDAALISRIILRGWTRDQGAELSAHRFRGEHGNQTDRIVKSCCFS